jgi:hypothetical protein
MSLNAQSRTAAHETGLRPTSMFYQPRARMLVMEFPRRGTYIYQGVTARAYDRLKCSMHTQVRFVRDEDRHFCVVEAR